MELPVNRCHLPPGAVTCLSIMVDNVPAFNLANHVTLCAHNPLGAKGCGEAGTIGAPAAIMNAVVNALTPLGVTDLAMPATPGRVACDCRTHSRLRQITQARAQRLD